MISKLHIKWPLAVLLVHQKSALYSKHTNDVKAVQQAITIQFSCTTEQEDSVSFGKRLICQMQSVAQHEPLEVDFVLLRSFLGCICVFWKP